MDIPEFYFWIGLFAVAGLFQLVKWFMSQGSQNRGERTPRAREARSYRPPQEDMEQFRTERPMESSTPPMPEPVGVEDLPEAPQPQRALAGDPTTEGHRMTADLPTQPPPATEGPSAAIPLEGPPPTAGPQLVASSVVERRTEVAALHRASGMRSAIRNALSSRQRIREAFILQEVIGRPKGLVSDDQAVERP